jgi:hypothetical protein
MSVCLQFEGIRCFSTPQQAEIRPITLLVGENSSGKSTFLAIYRLAYAIANNLNLAPVFNEPPFLLGAFDQIASLRTGRAGRAKRFSIRICRDQDSIGVDFRPNGGQPAIEKWRLSSADTGLEVAPREPRGCSIVLETGPATKEHPVRFVDPEKLLQLLGDIPLKEWQALLDAPKSLFSAAQVDTISKARRSLRQEFSRQPFAFAPIRTEPKRTYDPIAAQPEPEGSHVPMILARLARSSDRAEWNKLRLALARFGSGSGLFGEIDVVQKGKKESDPFQLGVRTGGPPVNLVDVGYGVSQILPILVDTLLRSSPHQDFLLQQPEVHLHPRAQAELGTFFANQADKRRRFLIETHSDYLVDRIRMEVRRGSQLSPADVVILYFERNEQGAKIHNLYLDRRGSIKNPPPGFRQFFLDEERELLEI